MIVRDYRETDWDAVREIYDLSKPDELRGIVDPEAIRPLRDDPAMLGLFRESVILVAADGGEVIGFGGYKGSYIAWLFVHPAHRREGMARALVSEVIARIGGAATLNVAASNHAARNLYRALGFETVREFEGRYNDRTVQVLTLRREP